MIKSELRIGYSLALFDIAKEENKIKEFYDQVKLIIKILDNEKEFVDILDSNLDNEDKTSIIDKTFSKFHWSLINVSKILSINFKFKYFCEILKKLIKYLQDELKIEEGIIYSIKPITPLKIKKLEDKLSKEYNKEISLKNLIDKELIGGFKIVLGSTVIEDSVKSELKLIKKSLILREERRE